VSEWVTCLSADCCFSDPRLEPTIYRTQGVHSNHYATAAAVHFTHDTIPYIHQPYSFIFKYLSENKQKVFKWKLLLCILKKMAISAFHYLTLSVRCEELDAHINYLYLFQKSTYCEYILEKKLSTSLSKLCVTLPFSINFRCQIKNQVSDYRLL
jgi:hypothetical protein